MIKILLVDDDNAILDSVGTLFKAYGFEVVSCNSPMKALDEFRNQLAANAPFDIVVTDFNMPGWSGLTLAMKIAGVSTIYEVKTPIICLTGNARDARRINEQSGSPMHLILEKGCAFKDIVNAIKCLTERTKAAGAN